MLGFAPSGTLPLAGLPLDGDQTNRGSFNYIVDTNGLLAAEALPVALISSPFVDATGDAAAHIILLHDHDLAEAAGNVANITTPTTNSQGYIFNLYKIGHSALWNPNLFRDENEPSITFTVASDTPANRLFINLKLVSSVTKIAHTSSVTGYISGAFGAIIRMADTLNIAPYSLASPTYSLREEMYLDAIWGRRTSVSVLPTEAIHIIDKIWSMLPVAIVESLVLTGDVAPIYSFIAAIADVSYLSASTSVVLDVMRTMTDQFVLSSVLRSIFDAFASEEINFSGNTYVVKDAYLHYAELLTLTTLAKNKTTTKSIGQSLLRVNEALSYIAGISCGEFVTLADLFTSDMDRIIALIDKVQLLSSTGGSTSYGVVVADIISFIEAALLARAIVCSDAFGQIDDTLLSVISLAVASDSISLADATQQTFTVVVAGTESIEVSDSWPATIRAMLSAKDSLLFINNLPIGDANYTAYTLNADTLGVTQYTNFPLTSITNHNGRLIGVTETGLYELMGDTDDGDPIEAYIRTGDISFGDTAQRTCLRAFLYLNSDDSVFLKTIASNHGRRTEDWYELLPRSADEEYCRKVTLGRGTRATTWGFEIRNVDGGKLSIDNAELIVPVEINRRG